MNIEKCLEIHRKELTYRRDFTLSGAFKIFCQSSQHRLSFDEFLFGLDRLDIAIKPTDVQLFFDRYDSDRDGKLGFWEFSNSILPIDARQRDELECRQSTIEMSYETKDLFKRVINRLVESEVQVEIQRNKLADNLTIGLREVFDQIDWLNRGFISKTDIKKIID